MNYPKPYEMDGIYYRIKRNGKWGNVCVSDMTAEERSELFGGSDPKYLLVVIKGLSDALREVGRFLEEEGYERRVA